MTNEVERVVMCECHRCIRTAALLFVLYAAINDAHMPATIGLNALGAMSRDRLEAFTHNSELVRPNRTNNGEQ